jgi:hypothetical protein
MLVVSKDGEIVGTNSYAIHAMEERVPIGFVQGLESLDFEVQPI